MAAGSLGDEPFREGLVSGFLLILFSELGDKTFFIAVLLALKKNKGLVFAGTFGALAVMTVISVRPIYPLLPVLLVVAPHTLQSHWALTVGRKTLQQLPVHPRPGTD